MQFVLKIGSERVGQGEVGGYTPLADNAYWQQLQLAVEKPWSVLGGPLVCFLAQKGIENGPFTILYFWHFRQLLVRRSILWLEGPDY